MLTMSQVLFAFGPSATPSDSQVARSFDCHRLMLLSPFWLFASSHAMPPYWQLVGCAYLQPMWYSSHTPSAPLHTTVGLCANVPTTSLSNTYGPAGVPLVLTARITRLIGLQ